MDGFFTRACIFNSAGEGNVWINPELHNQDDTGNAFCLMIDGLHHYDPLSHYIASRWAKDQPDSCIQHEIVNADFEIVRGTPLFLSNVNQFRASGYAATGQDEHFYPAVLFLAGSGLATFRDLEIDLHAEGFLTCNVRFEYNNVPPDVSSHPISIEGFHLHDFGSAATVALIEAGTNISELEIVSGDLFKGTGVLVPFTSGPCSISAGVRTNYQYQKIGPYAFTLEKESATSFEVPGTLSSAVLVLQSDGAGTECAMVWLRANASAAIQDIGSARGADVNLMIGALSGTTGALGKITVSANTDGRFYIENRIGSTRSFTVMLVGS
jgi:hypothetical protein